MGLHLLIRADAGPSIGSGHVMRCLALAQEWQAQGGKVTFLGCCQSKALRQRATSAGVELVLLERTHPHPDDLARTLALAERLDSPWLVLDGYHFTPVYQQAIRATGRQLLVIDDTAHQPKYHADIVLNQNINALKLNYQVDPGTILLLGTRYTLLRSEFLAWRGWQREIPDVARRLLVTLGGSDPDNITLKVIRGLQRVQLEDIEATVVVGPANPHLETLQQAVEACGPKLRLLTNVYNMPDLMAWADVAISGSGSTCWELAFMGLPSLLLVLAENQKGIATGMQTVGAAIDLGYASQISPDGLSAAMVKLAGGYRLRRAMSGRGRLLVDGNGPSRTLEALHRYRRPGMTRV